MGKIRLGIIGTGQRVYQHGDVVFKNCLDYYESLNLGLS